MKETTKLSIDPMAAVPFVSEPASTLQLYKDKIYQLSQEVSQQLTKTDPHSNSLLEEPLADWEKELLGLPEIVAPPGMGTIIQAHPVSHWHISPSHEISSVPHPSSDEYLMREIGRLVQKHTTGLNAASSHDQEGATFDVNKWISDHIEIRRQNDSKEPYVVIRGNADNLTKENRVELLKVMLPMMARENVREELLTGLLNSIIGYTYRFPRDASDVLAETYPRQLVENIQSFPYAIIDQHLADRLMNSGVVRGLLCAFDRLDSSVDRQDLLKRIVETSNGILLAAQYLHFPHINKYCPIETSYGALIGAIQSDSYSVVELLKRGFIAVSEEHVDRIKQALISAGRSDFVLMHEMFQNLTLEDVGLATNGNGALLGRCQYPLQTLYNYKKVEGLDLADGSLQNFVDQYCKSIINACDHYSIELPEQTVGMIFSSALQCVLQDGKFYSSGYASGWYERCRANALYKQAMDNVLRLFGKDFTTSELVDLCNRFVSLRSVLEGVFPEISHFINTAVMRAQNTNDSRVARRKLEEQYFTEGSYSINVYEASAEIPEAELMAAFELEHCAKRLPTLREQAVDNSRTNMISQGAGSMSHSSDANQRETLRVMTEVSAINDYITTVTSLIDKLAVDDTEKTKIRKRLVDELSFVGEKEYEEAVSSIAKYWKILMRKDKLLQINIQKGAISNGYGIKSDEYMLDRILAHFNDDDLNEFRGRLLINDLDSLKGDPEHVRIVFLDDWTISGSQLRSATTDFIQRYPDLAGRLEIQLIASVDERVGLGLEGVQQTTKLKKNIRINETPIIVRSYYLAHGHSQLGQDPNLFDNLRSNSARGVSITGAHSSVDFGFELLIEAMFPSNHDDHMPPLTNIQRPYRLPGYRTENTDRALSRMEKG